MALPAAIEREEREALVESHAAYARLVVSRGHRELAAARVCERVLAYAPHHAPPFMRAR